MTLSDMPGGKIADEVEFERSAFTNLVVRSAYTPAATDAAEVGSL